MQNETSNTTFDAVTLDNVAETAPADLFAITQSETPQSETPPAEVTPEVSQDLIPPLTPEGDTFTPKVEDFSGVATPETPLVKEKKEKSVEEVYASCKGLTQPFTHTALYESYHGKYIIKTSPNVNYYDQLKSLQEKGLVTLLGKGKGGAKIYSVS